MSEQVKTWRLSKSTARRLEFRPIENEDMRYIWAAYQKGSLPFTPGLSAAEFKEAFEKFILHLHDAAWTMFAETKKGFIPVGIVTGFWPHPDITHVMFGNQFMWFPWASTRNRIESAVNFFNQIRSEMPMKFWVSQKDKKFFEMIARHGIVRRIGTSLIMRPGEAVAEWETRI